MARIDRLDVGDRAVLRRAAVLGLSFHPRMLGWLTLDGEPAPEVESLERLGGYFEDDGNGYLRFRHALVRETAYQGLPFRTRRRLHEAAGRALESETEEPEELSASSPGTSPSPATTSVRGATAAWLQSGPAMRGRTRKPRDSIAGRWTPPPVRRSTRWSLPTSGRRSAWPRSR